MDIIHFDGACDRNPGCSAFGFSHSKLDTEVHFECGFIGENYTNNYAEYSALLKALLYCKFANVNNPVIKGDSALVVNQVNGQWKVKCANLKDINTQCRKLMREVEANLVWIPREENIRADYLSKLPLNHRM